MLLSKNIVIPLTDMITTSVIAGVVTTILVALIAVVVMFVIVAGAVLYTRKKKQNFSLTSQGR